MLTSDDVARLVGTHVAERGADYVRSGNVLSVARNADGSTVVAHVRGSGLKQYVATVHLTGSGDAARPLYGQCSCPVGLNCKHVAAALLAYARKQSHPEEAATPLARRPEPGGWEAVFAPVLPAASSRETNAVALQFELMPGDHGGSLEDRDAAPQLAVRPVVRGARGRWVRQGMSWADLRYSGAYLHRDLPRAHLDVLRSILGIATATLRGSHYQVPAWIYLDELPGPALWALLADARRVGLPFVQGDKGQTPVALTAAPARVALDVARVGEDAGGDRGLLVTTRVVVDDEPADLRTLAFVGSPASGVFTWSPAGTHLTLAPLAVPLTDAEVALALRSEPVTVPSDEEERFLAAVYPSVRDRFDVLAGPGVTLPEPPRPHLRLDATHEAGHRLRVQWSWDTAPDGEESVALARHLVRLVTAAAPVAGLGWSASDSLGAPPVRELEGMATARFFTGELPGLEALVEGGADLTVQLHGREAGVEYREEPDVEVSVTAEPQAGSRDWFDLGVSVRAGDVTIPFADVFAALAKGESLLLLSNGTYFSLDDDRFGRLKDLIEEARALQDTMGGTLRVNRYQAGLFEELEHLGLLDVQANAWRTALGALADGRGVEQVEPPAGLDASLRSYQQEGFDWLAFLHGNGLGGILADDMGLGKTLQALALVAHAGTRSGPFLVVAPTSVVGNWVSEARRFTPGLRVEAVSETRARRKKDLAEVVRGADIVVTSYAVFRLGFAEFEGLGWSGLILDEAQFIKNHQSIAYQCARRLDVPFKLAVTGTPLENNLMELWSLMSVVCPGLFPHPRLFAEYYQRPIEKQQSTQRLEQLRRRIAPFMLRRAKEDVAKDLPAKQEQVLEVTLTPKHRKVYDRYLQRERKNVLGLVDSLDENRFLVFRSLSVLRQAALDPSLVDEEHAGVGSSKLDVLFEMLSDVLAEGHSVLVFSQFTQYLAKVRERLDAGGIDHSYLDGRTRKRAQTIERFTSGETKVFLISLKAGGFGLNLTAADYCFLLDPWWNPATEAQAVDRAHRIGQDRNVMVYRLVATDTIEEKVMALKESKAKLFTSVLDGGAAGGGGLTPDDVRELLG